MAVRSLVTVLPETQGGFFGENAQEMTGLFINEADQARGAFGGIKQ